MARLPVLTAFRHTALCPTGITFLTSYCTNFSNLLRYIYQIKLYVFKVYITVTWYTYTLWKDFHSPPLHLGNSHIHHLTYLSCVWDHLSSTLLVNFSCTIMLSPAVTVFYTRSSVLTHLRADSLYPFNNLSLFPHPPVHGNHHCFLFGWLFPIYFAYVKCVYSWI